jgi:S1-C subfamily serine protease
VRKLIHFLIVFVLGFGTCAYILKWYNGGTGSQSVMQALSTNPVGSVVTKGKNPIADAVAKVGPAVVSIYTIATREVQNPFGDMFGIPPQTEVDKGAGSGIIISKDGYILTNNHVVAGATKIRVHLKDGRSFDARLIGRDPSSEVAVIKISASNLPIAELGNSDDIRVGDWAIAISFRPIRTG